MIVLVGQLDVHGWFPGPRCPVFGPPEPDRLVLMARCTEGGT